MSRLGAGQDTSYTPWDDLDPVIFPVSTSQILRLQVCSNHAT